jgi:hypothetical protein
MNRRRFLQSAGVGAGLGMFGGAFGFHDRLHQGLSVQPAPGEIQNMEILGYCNMNFGDVAKVRGWDQVYEFQVINGFAYCSHSSNGTRGLFDNQTPPRQIPGTGGFSIVDVRNPRNMKVIFRRVNDAPTPTNGGPGDNSQYLDIKDHIMVLKRNRSLEMWDVSNPFAPVRLSSFTPPGILVGSSGDPNDPHGHGSFGYHGMWVHLDGRGGRFAYASVRLEGYTDQILIIVDITNPMNPHEVGRWWYPGMWHDGHEVPTWATNDGSPGQTGTPVQCHDITTYGDRAYVAWRDKGVIILDISNPRNPTRVGEINWGDVSRPLAIGGKPAEPFHPIPSQVHSIGVVVPKRGRSVETVIAGDEVGRCPGGYMHIIDVRNEKRPQEISDFQTPFNRGGNCPYDRNVSRSAMHDVDRMIRGKIAWAAWEEGGFWGVDISDIHYPRAAAWYVPPARSDAGRAGSSHGDDMTTGSFGSDSGLVFGSGSDTGAGGIWAFRYNPGYSAKVRWNSDESNVIVTETSGKGKGRDRDDDD